MSHQRAPLFAGAAGSRDCPPSLIAGAVRTGERVFLTGANAMQADGSVKGLGDPAAQTHAAIDNLEARLAAVGGSLKGVTKLTTCIVDRDHRKAVYEVIGTRLKDVFPGSTGLVVAGLPLPEMMVQIDAEAIVGSPVKRHRTFEMKGWFSQPIAWQGSMINGTDQEIFIRGQTGSHLDGKVMTGLGRRPQDAAEQADQSLANLKQLLEEMGSGLDDVTKITVYISDRGYRHAVYPVIGKYFRGVHPVSTGLIVPAFARHEILFEIDAQALRKVNGAKHTRIRPYHSKNVRYGTEQQAIDCDFCMGVKAGKRIVLRGQTGTDLNEKMHGLGDAAAQARQAMDNVEVLLGEAGARMRDVTKAIVFVTDRAFLAGVTDVVLKRFGDTIPAFSAFIVKGLASPELLMEVDITAALPEGSP